MRIKKLRRVRLGRRLRIRGGAFDFFGVLRKVGNAIQKGIDTVAPVTSKLFGPVATALTGVPIPNLSGIDLSGGKPAGAQAVAPSPPPPRVESSLGTADTGKLAEQAAEILKKAMAKGVKKTGKGLSLM